MTANPWVSLWKSPHFANWLEVSVGLVVRQPIGHVIVTEVLYLPPAMRDDSAQFFPDLMSSRETRNRLMSSLMGAGLPELMDELLVDDDLFATVRVISAPRTGSVQLQLREPVCDERFIIGDVVVTTAEVSVDGTAGWSMVMGEDPRGALAGALADAILSTESSELKAPRDRILAALSRAAAELSDITTAEDAQLESTVIDFEELD